MEKKEVYRESCEQILKQGSCQGIECCKCPLYNEPSDICRISDRYQQKMAKLWLKSYSSETGKPPKKQRTILIDRATSKGLAKLNSKLKTQLEDLINEALDQYLFNHTKIDYCRGCEGWFTGEELTMRHDSVPFCKDCYGENV